MREIDEYIRLAEEWGRSLDGNYIKHRNSLRDQIQAAFETIVSQSKQSELFSKVDRVSEPVRFFMAAHATELDPEMAKRTYTELMKSTQPFIAVNSKFLLAELT